MTEKQFLNAEKSQAVEKTGGKFEKSKLEKELVKLLKDKTLSREKVIETAGKMSMSVLILCHRIFARGQKEDESILDEYINYARQIGEESSREEVALSFLEKRQQKSEPEKVEQESQTVDVPKTPVVPMISPKEESQPMVVPSKASKKLKVPSVAPVLPKKTKEVVPQPEKRNWWEVKRETEVMAAEDLSGSMDIFERHVKALGVAKKDASGHWNWTGGDKKVVFLGDILGDYGMDGIEITNTIFDLAKQAEKVGGKMDMLCGNHDAFLINLLCKGHGKEHYIAEADGFFSLFSGVWELAQYDPELKEVESKKRTEMKKLKEEEADKIKELLVGLFYERIPLIMTNMKNSSEGRRILENICQIKVAVVHDDTLFCHTDPTFRMITDLTKDGNISQRVSEINKIFQENLRKVFFEGDKLGDNFKFIDGIYLNTDNREYFTEQEAFENIAENMLVRSVEYLYENKQIKFDKDVEDSFGEYGFNGIKWNTWKRLLSKNLVSADVDMKEGDLGEWKRKNGIRGEYIDEVGGILSKLFIMRQTKNDKEKKAIFEALDELFDSMAEKIKKLNLEDSIQKVRNSGINAIIHGHSPYRSRPYHQYGSNKVGRYHDENGLIIVSPHASFYDETNYRDFEKGISVIKTNGEVDLMGKIFRNKRS